MTQIQIIDGAMSNESFKSMQTMVLSDKFPWYFEDFILHDLNAPEQYQFFHQVYGAFAPQSKIFDAMGELFNILTPTALVTARFNLLPRTEEIKVNPFHIDIPNCKVAVLYINTNNGVTNFQSGESVESVENRLVIFDSSLPHAGTTCTDEKRRIVLNINYI